MSVQPVKKKNCRIFPMEQASEFYRWRLYRTGNANNFNSLGTQIKRENEMDRYQRAPRHLERLLGRYAEEFSKIFLYLFLFY